MGNVIHCVLGFMFSEDSKRVLLIEKIRPEFQAGRLNGIGGKIEKSDSSSKFAMTREFEEECGICTLPNDWTAIGRMLTDDYLVEIFKAIGNIDSAKSVEAEQVKICDIANLPSNCMNNIHWLIPYCLDNDEKYLCIDYENII